jgi:hypothetical protein
MNDYTHFHSTPPPAAKFESKAWAPDMLAVDSQPLGIVAVDMGLQLLAT